MTDMFTPQFTDHFDLPEGSFHRRLNYDGNVCDIYFFKQPHGDDYMCRYGDNGPDYTSGRIQSMLLPLAVDRKLEAKDPERELRDRIQHNEDTIELGRYYLEWTAQPSSIGAICGSPLSATVTVTPSPSPNQ